MLAAYKATGDREILASVERQMDQWIDMLERRGLALHDTGAGEMNGLPSMSVLKPLVLLYEETGRDRYLEYARKMLPDWDRDDNACPNFFRNAKRDVPLSEWYPRLENWAKSYELMSCLDGLLEYYRATGDARCLDAVSAIRDNLERTESNPLGSVGFGDKFIGGAKRVNALNEVCDAIHWIRLNLDLFLITGEDRYLDSMELAYFNCFLAGIHRSGEWGAFFVRGHGRHQDQRQCGYSYSHCCVNNVPRTFMDMASAAVTVDAKGVYHVNLYQDADVTLDGVKFGISGDYPVGSEVTVRTSRPVDVKFRRPAWCAKMDVSRIDGGYSISFDMNPRIVNRTFDPEQNKDPETAYFNGMVLRVKRALQCLKTLKEWNGKDLYASGGNQGGLQTIWAAGCGEGVTRADSAITWCCDMHSHADRLAKKASSGGWYIPWTEAMGYYDAVNWAKRIPTACRTNITRAGLGDYCCPPMGLAKLWNSIPGSNKSIVWVQGSEHGYVPPQYEGRDFRKGIGK